MFLTKPILTRREPLKRATLRIKLHIPLIKLIKKDQVCYSAAPSTTNQNATQRIYIKDIKWLGKSLYAYSIKMQYEIVIKGDRCCSCYTCLRQTVPAARTAQKMAPGTGTGAPQMDRRLLTSKCPKTRHDINIHANNRKT